MQRSTPDTGGWWLGFDVGGTRTKAGVKKKGNSAVLDTSASGDAAPAQAAAGNAPPSRGYREEIEHWAWCISTGDFDNQPRCNGPVALADAVIALTAKQAIKNTRDPNIGHGHIQFQPNWFDVDKDDIPEAVGAAQAKKFIEQEKRNLGLA